MQLQMFEAPAIPRAIGRAAVGARQASGILAKGQGALADYDYTMNPYIGCTFGCAYCYAAFFVPDEAKARDWGNWVEVKENALELLARCRKLGGAKVALGTATDPYQPVEAKLGLTRSLLEYMASLPEQPRIHIQTRSPLIARDVDLLRRFRDLKVGVSVTTDDDEVRRRYEPAAPSIPRRLETLRILKANGIRTAAFMMPLLPVTNPWTFADELLAVQADTYVVCAFRQTRGPFAAGTRDMAVDMAREHGWNADRYKRAVMVLRTRIPGLHVGGGFLPE